MNDLPRGWALTTIAAAGETRLGKQRAPKWHTGPNMRPYLRVANVFEDRIDVSDVKSMHFEPDEVATFELRPGDVLLNEGQSPEFLGRPAIYRDELPGVCFTNSLIRFRPHPGILSEWALTVFRHHMHSGRFRLESQITTNIAHLSLGRLNTVEFPVPPTAEQERIVAAIKEQFSRIDEAESSLRYALAKLNAMQRSVLATAVCDDWPITRLGDIVTTASGGTPSRMHPEYFGGSIPWVKSGELRDGIVMAPEETITELGLAQSSAKIFAKGTLLIALYGATIGKLGILGLDAATNQAVCAVTPNDPLMVPYLHLVLKEKRQELVNAAQGGAQPNISQTILRELIVPVPSIEEQRRLVAAADRHLSLIESLTTALEHTLARASRLRSSILRSAFSGQLVPQDPADVPAPELAVRIGGQEETEGGPRRRERV